MVTSTVETHITPIPPKVKGLPFLGSALQMQRDPLEFILEQAKIYGPVFRIEAAGRAFTVMAGIEANVFAAREGDNHWSSREFWSPFSEEINAKHFLAATEGEAHSRLRKIVKKPYSREFVLGQLPALISVTEQMTATWTPGQVIAVYPYMQHLVTEQIGQLLLGKGPGVYFDDFVIFMKTILSVVTGRRPRRMLHGKKYLQAKAHILDLARDLLARENVRSLSDEQADLIDYLLNSQKDNADILAEPELLIGAVGPYLAGIDTSASAVSFMVYALLKHPQWLPEIVAEVDRAFEEGPLTAEKVRAMPALHAATIEAQRRYPVSPMIQRFVTKPYDFAGYHIDAGTTIMLANGAAHFDPKQYTEPRKFDPARCREPQNEHKKAGAYAPFGVGAHTCPGAGFAEVQITASIAALLRTFELELAPPTYELRTVYNPGRAPDKNFAVRIKARRHTPSVG